MSVLSSGTEKAREGSYFNSSSTKMLHLLCQSKCVMMTVRELKNDPDCHFELQFHQQDTIWGSSPFLASLALLGDRFEALSIGVESYHGQRGLDWQFYVGSHRIVAPEI